MYQGGPILLSQLSTLIELDIVDMLHNDFPGELPETSGPDLEIDLSKVGNMLFTEMQNWESGCGL